MNQLEKDFQIIKVLDFLPAHITQEALNITKKLQDNEYYTTLEKERFYSCLENEKKYILKYFKEMVDFKKTNLGFLKDKLLYLKGKELEIINSQIKFFENLTKDIEKNLKENLIFQKNSLIKEVDKITSNLKELISKIAVEKKMLHNKQSLQNTLDTVSALISSKTWDFDLKIPASKPIDLATIPLTAKNTRTALFSAISFIVAFILSFVFLIYLAILRGFPIAKEALKDLKKEFLGKISFYCSGFEIEEIKKTDLETLRNIISNIQEEQKIITSIAQDGPNYTHYLAALLAIVGKKVLVIETNTKNKEDKGLFSYLERKTKEIPIQTLEAYDFLPSGEEKYFSFELLSSKEFTNLLASVRKKYDHILIYANYNYDSSFSKLFLNSSDKIILTIKDEIKDNLREYLSNENVSYISY